MHEPGETEPQTRRRLSREERRAELLQSAMRVFAKRGIGAARHAEIADEAKVSVATTFVYFPTRADLVRDVLAEVARIYLEMAREVHDTSAPAPQVLLRHATSFAESIERHPDHARVWLNWSTAVRDEIWPMYLEFQQQMLATIAATIRRGQDEGTMMPDVDPEETARLCVAGAHMIAQLELTGSPRATVDRFIRTLIRAAGSTDSGGGGRGARGGGPS